MSASTASSSDTGRDKKSPTKEVPDIKILSSDASAVSDSLIGDSVSTSRDVAVAPAVSRSSSVGPASTLRSIDSSDGSVGASSLQTIPEESDLQQQKITAPKKKPSADSISSVDDSPTRKSILKNIPLGSKHPSAAPGRPFSSSGGSLPTRFDELLDAKILFYFVHPRACYKDLTITLPLKELLDHANVYMFRSSWRRVVFVPAFLASFESYFHKHGLPLANLQKLLRFF